MKQTRNKIMAGIDLYRDRVFFSTARRALRQLKWGVVLLAALLLPLTAFAAPVQITSISGLHINTEIYDVAFAYGSFNTLFDKDDDRIFGEADGSAFNHAPTFWGDQAGAMAAAQAIINELGTNSYLSNYFGSLVDSFFVPYGDSYGNISLYEDYDSDMEKDTLQVDWYLDNAYSGLNPIAVFTKISTVPVPSAILFLASGILGLAGVRRRKNSTNFY
jgi:hypothetical protein